MMLSKSLKIKRKIKLLCFYLAGVLCFVIKELFEIEIMKMTRPSAFCYIMKIVVIFSFSIFILLSVLPINLRCKLLKNSQRTDMLISVLLLIQMCAALSIGYFSFRLEYFNLFITHAPYQWTELFYAIFFIALFAYNRFSSNKLFVIISGIVYICLEVSYYYFSDYKLNYSTFFNLLIVFFYIVNVCTFENFKCFMFFYPYMIEVAYGNESTKNNEPCYLISIYKDEKQDLLLLYCPSYKEYMMFNSDTEEFISINEVHNIEDFNDGEFILFLDSLAHKYNLKVW